MKYISETIMTKQIGKRSCNNQNLSAETKLSSLGTKPLNIKIIKNKVVDETLI